MDTTTTPSAQEAAEEAGAPSPTHGRRRAALTLALLSPLVAEVTLGTTPLSVIWLVLFYVPMYGAGALLIRELARRRGIGWGGVLLLGVCYMLLEEGLALQSLTSPRLYGAARWAPRVLGVNSAYTEVQLIYHAVFSVAVPIALTELIHPRLGRRPYLRRPGLVVTAIVTVLGAGVVRALIPPFADPGYVQPAPAVAGILAVGVVLAWIALWVAPRRPAVRTAVPFPVPPGSVPGSAPGSGSGSGPTTAPSPRTVGAVGLASTFAVLALLFPFGGARQPAFTHGGWVAVPMLAAAAVAAGTLAGLRRWGRAPTWGHRHTFAVVAGALVAHTSFALLAMLTEHRWTDAIGLGAVGGVMCLFLALLHRAVPREDTDGGVSSGGAGTPARRR
jgi:hypothetical protein